MNVGKLISTKLLQVFHLQVIYHSHQYICLLQAAKLANAILSSANKSEERLFTFNNLKGTKWKMAMNKEL